jgi:coenzyme PQQ synthesis protein D (PqqD)
VSCELAGGAALLDLRSGTYFSVNPVGAHVWSLLRAPVAVSDIHGALAARYDVEPAQCYADLIELLQELAEAGLIKVADGEGG